MADQMPSHVLPWQASCVAPGAGAGGTLIVCPRPADFDWTRALLQCLDDHAAVLGAAALCGVDWTDGCPVTGLNAIGAKCAALGIPLVLDLTQSAGSLPVNLASIPGVAFAAASVHKWLLGPYGFSLVYCNPTLQASAVPLEEHDRQRAGAHDVEVRGGKGRAGLLYKVREGGGGGRRGMVGVVCRADARNCVRPSICLTWKCY
jgi:kynureninase